MDRIFNAIDEINKVIKGKEQTVTNVMIALLCRGHVLLEDIPGVGKTTLALAFSRVLGLSYKRMQFTPDVMPSDISGFSMYNQQTRSFEYKEGAIMCNLFLADEINRTSPKTQSALLEVMEEGKVTVDGITHPVPSPFTVIATQNPYGSSGTQKLPQSQMDRFLMCISMGYPDTENEINILKNHISNKTEGLNTVLSAEILQEAQKQVSEIYVDDSLYSYIVDIANETRKSESFSIGISPRGSIALLNASRANAFINKRGYVIPEDITQMLEIVCSHRIELSPKARAKGITPQSAISTAAKNIKMPKLK